MGYTVKVSNVSDNATERDIYDFFAFSGEISSIQTKAAGPEAPGTQEAYVTFQDERSLETALLLTGAVIADKPVTVELAEGYVPPATSAAGAYAADGGGSKPGSGNTLKKAEEMMASLLASGYILGKDAMEKAKTLDEKHALSATAKTHASALSRSAAELDSKYSLSKKLAETGATVSQQLSSVDEKYQVTTKTKEALTVAEHSLTEAGQYVMQNKYVSSGASWLMGALGQLKTIVADVQQQTSEKVHKSEEERAAAGQGTGAAAAGAAAAGVAGAPGQGTPLLGLEDHGPSVGGLGAAGAAPAPPASLLDAPPPAPAAPAPSPALQREPSAKSALGSSDPPVF